VPIFHLSEELIFPSPLLAEPDGVLAVGGDLSLQRLILAYQNGIFPWYNTNEPIIWHCPNPRFVLFSHKIKISKSLAQCIRNTEYTITVNKAFEEVINNCSKIQRKDQDDTWIVPEMKEAYLHLHQKGFATSVEVWENDNLVGGLYGVSLGKSFFGESMFHKVPNASKIALVHLAQKMNYELIDCQVHTNHLESLGAEYIPLANFLNIINQSNNK
jgi:leucyl/phenylalanyl-tRNA--protein transferase